MKRVGSHILEYVPVTGDFFLFHPVEGLAFHAVFKRGIGEEVYSKNLSGQEKRISRTDYDYATAYLFGYVMSGDEYVRFGEY